MNDEELSEVINMKSLTFQEEDGVKRHLMSIPLTQSLTQNDYKLLKDQKSIALKCKELSDQVLAIIDNPEFFPNWKEEICNKFFGTNSRKHQKV